MKTLSVGVLGTGLMGAPMARAMAGAGWAVRGWARRPEAAQAVEGIIAVASPRELGACDILVSVLPDLPELEAVLSDGLLDAVGDWTTLVICSTSSPVGVCELADRLASRGVSVVDAPVSGGEKKAIDATLAIMVGGDDDDVARVLPLLEACGTPIHLGPLGSGEIAKACNQMIISATTTSLAEVAVLAVRSGLDLGALFGLLGQGLAGSEVLEQKAPKLVARDYSVSGPAKYMVKDLRFALDQAQSVGVDLRLARQAREIFVDMTQAGYGDLDTTALAAYIEAGAADDVTVK